MTTYSLQEIASRHGTDKAAAGHSYIDFYEELFAPLRDRPIRLLEIGVGGNEDPRQGGASLRAWKEYFPKAEIIGLDYFDKSRFAEERIHVERGDQADPVTLDRLIARYAPFDIVIDDGSHLSRDVIARDL